MSTPTEIEMSLVLEKSKFTSIFKNIGVAIIFDFGVANFIWR